MRRAAAAVRGVLSAARAYPARAPVAWAVMWPAAALLLAFLLFPAGWLLPSDRPFLDLFYEKVVARGQPLLHAVPGFDFKVMPLLPAASVFFTDGTWAQLQRFWLFLGVIICGAGFSLGCLLAGPAGGLAAAALLFFWPGLGSDYYAIEQRFYLLPLLLACCALVLREGRRGRGTVLVSCALGISFLARSALCWFPVLTALRELLSRGAECGGRRGRALLALLLPFVFLLPWVYKVYAYEGVPRLFDGRAEGNMATGAAGSAGTFEGDYRLMAGLGPFEDALVWSAGRIFTDPGRYAEAFARRCWLLLSAYLPLLAAWVAVSWLLRRDPAFLAASLLPAYLLAVHLAFSSELRYLAPVLPLIAALTAAGWLRVAGARPDARRGILWFVFSGGPAVLLAAWCLLLLLRYPARADYDHSAALERASKSGTWGAREYGLNLLRRGEYSAAYAYLGRAYIGTAGNAAAGTWLSAAALRLNSGDGRAGPGSDMALRFGPAAYTEKDVEARHRVLAAAAALAAGDRAAAASRMRAAVAARRSGVFFKQAVDAAGEKEQRESDPRVASRFIPEVLAVFPEDERGAVCAELARLYDAAAAPGARTIRGYCGGAVHSGLLLAAAYSYAPAGKDRGRAVLLLGKCRQLAGLGRSADALTACREALFAAEADGDGLAAADAALETYRLFAELGRPEEGAEALRWAAASAPAGWSGGAEARRLLEKGSAASPGR